MADDQNDDTMPEKRTVTIEEMIESAKEAKVEYEWGTPPPVLQAVMEDPSQPDALVLLDLPPGPELFEAIAMLMADLRNNGKIDFVIFGGDFWIEEGDEPSLDDRSLQERADQGEQVPEAMMILIVRQDGSWEHARVPYHTDTQTWDEATILRSTDEDVESLGPLLEVLLLAVADVVNGKKVGFLEEMFEMLKKAKDEGVIPPPEDMERIKQEMKDLAVEFGADPDELDAFVAEQMAQRRAMRAAQSNPFNQTL